MLFTALWAFREVSEATNACYLQRLVLPGMGRTAKEATNACYLQHFGSSGRYRPQRRRMHAIYSTLRLQGGIGSNECMLFIIRCPPGIGRTAKEATIVCYLQHFGPSGRYRMPRKRRIHAIYNTLGPQGGIGSHECMLFTALCHPRNGSDRQGSDECMLFTALWVLSVVSDQGSKECMLFTILWAPEEISEATIVCYLQHVGPPGRYRRPRLHAIYDTLGPQGGIGSHECMLFSALCHPRNGSDRQGSDECMLLTAL